MLDLLVEKSGWHDFWDENTSFSWKAVTQRSLGGFRKRHINSLFFQALSQSGAPARCSGVVLCYGYSWPTRVCVARRTSFLPQHGHVRTPIRWSVEILDFMFQRSWRFLRTPVGKKQLRNFRWTNDLWCLRSFIPTDATLDPPSAQT